MNKKLLISLAIIIPSVIIIVLIGFSMFSTKKENVEDLILSTNSINLEVEESVNLNDYFSVYPKNAKAIVMCLIDDSYYAVISKDNIVTAKNIGTTQIYLKVSSGSNNIINKTIGLNVKEKSVIPTNFSFEKSEVNLGINTQFAINNLISENEYNVTPVITYSTNNVCSYDYQTGKVLPINLGSTIVTVTFKLKNKEISQNFKVNVKETYRTIELSYEKENDCYIIDVELNTTKSLNVFVYEDGVVVNGEIKIDVIENNAGFNLINNEMGTIIYRCSTSGETKLKISCVEDSSVFIFVILKGE